MSDRLDHDLAALSGQAQAQARPAPAAAIAARGARRRRRRLAAMAAVPIVAAAAVVGGVVASSGGSGHRSQPVSVTGPHPSSKSAGSAKLLTIPTPQVSATTGVGGLSRCTVTTNPVTSAAYAAERGSLRADPVTISAVWIPAVVARSGCHARVTTAGAASAARLVAALQRATSPKGAFHCPMVLGANVDLVFQYATGPRLAVVAVHLGGCDQATLPGNQTRFATAAVGLLPQLLQPPSWALGLTPGGTKSLGTSTATP